MTMVVILEGGVFWKENVDVKGLREQWEGQKHEMSVAEFFKNQGFIKLEPGQCKYFGWKNCERVGIVNALSSQLGTNW